MFTTHSHAKEGFTTNRAFIWCTHTKRSSSHTRLSGVHFATDLWQWRVFDGVDWRVFGNVVVDDVVDVSEGTGLALRLEVVLGDQQVAHAPATPHLTVLRLFTHLA